MKPSQKPLDIGNCPLGGSQNSLYTTQVKLSGGRARVFEMPQTLPWANTFRLLSLYLPEAAHGRKKVFNQRGGKIKWTKRLRENYFEEGIKN